MKKSVISLCLALVLTTTYFGTSASALSNTKLSAQPPIVTDGAGDGSEGGSGIKTIWNRRFVEISNREWNTFVSISSYIVGALCPPLKAPELVNKVTGAISAVTGYLSLKLPETTYAKVTILEEGRYDSINGGYLGYVYTFKVEHYKNYSCTDYITTSWTTHYSTTRLPYVN